MALSLWVGLSFHPIIHRDDFEIELEEFDMCMCLDDVGKKVN